MILRSRLIFSVVPRRESGVMLGAVHDLEVRHEGGPLVFFRGGYGRYSL